MMRSRTNDSISFLKYVVADSSRRHTMNSNHNHMGSTFSNKRLLDKARQQDGNQPDTFNFNNVAHKETLVGEIDTVATAG